MHRGSTRHRAAVLLIGLLLVLSNVNPAAGHPRPDPPEEECEDDPAACVFGAMFAVIMAPFTYPFSGLRTSYRPADPSGMGVRLDRAIRALGAPYDRTHPFVGVGWQASIYPRRTYVDTVLPPNIDNAFEAALGYQLALDPLLNRSTSRSASVIWTTEVQWLLGSDDASVRGRTGPGISLDMGEEQRLRLHLNIAVNLAGSHHGGVRPGFGIGWSWK